ncbi:hypothetical protein AGABI2DRAFT_203833 [Agaricus bisporus var. bisporus H97]|uniref:hypothetical protein n=1 Tax=Agaricus bisporus var. bisporus (strain H97 / ATCC MYA-4626 / FGSC 10389) TaxID=936046 RepID=UPI00029F598F|nr:hypothetical protein AGABI2DRAFT_203833 [Agaricus bisporus var. bisporus H97]EKV47042.1 hypothetical protein AGABI2DRAFT_203833 [Agaricus bisporus var. bisporus H97]
MRAEGTQSKQAMESPSTRSLMRIECFRVASLAFFIYEIALTLDQEVEFVWPQPNKSWLKWQYFFTRYFGLTASIANRVIDYFSMTSTGLVPTPLRRWVSCQVIIGGALILSVETQLMMRVYALYKRSTRVALLLLFLLLCEIVFAIIGLVLKPDTGAYSTSVALLTPDSFIYFGISATIVQFIVLTLTILKYKSLATTLIVNTSVASCLLKDEILGFVITLFVTTWAWLSAITHLTAGINDSWLLAIVSCIGSRLVLERLSKMKKPPELSTFLSSPRLMTYADSFGEPQGEPS